MLIENKEEYTNNRKGSQVLIWCDKYYPILIKPIWINNSKLITVRSEPKPKHPIKLKRKNSCCQSKNERISPPKLPESPPIVIESDLAMLQDRWTQTYGQRGDASSMVLTTFLIWSAVGHEGPLDSSFRGLCEGKRPCDLKHTYSQDQHIQSDLAAQVPSLKWM